METINRQEKLDHLEASGSQLSDYFISPEKLQNKDIANGLSAALTNEALTLPFLRGSKFADYHSWLTNSSTAQSLISKGASKDETLSAYGEFIQMDHQRVDAIIAKTRGKFGRRLRHLAHRGLIPEVLSERFDQNKSATHVSMAIFDSSYNPEAAGKYVADQHGHYYRPFRPDSENVRRYIHESFHGLSSATTHKDKRQLYTSRIGLATKIVDERGYRPSQMRHRAINEGITEYLTNLTLHDMPGQVSTEKREENDSGVYKEERKIVEILANRIGLNTLLDAYAEDYDPQQPNMQHTRTLMREVRSFYGPGFLHKVDKIDREKGVKAALEFVKKADAEVTKTLSKSRSYKLNKTLAKLGLR